MVIYKINIRFYDGKQNDIGSVIKLYRNLKKKTRIINNNKKKNTISSKQYIDIILYWVYFI